MAKLNGRLTELTPDEASQLQRQAERLARLDHFLSRLPLGLQAECLSEKGFDRLRRIAQEPELELSGPLILRWHGARRTPLGLAQHSSV